MSGEFTMLLFRVLLCAIRTFPAWAVAALIILAASPVSAQQTPPPASSPEDAFKLDPELEALNQQARALMQEGKLAEALPIADRFAAATKDKPGMLGIMHKVALLNLDYIYKQAMAKLSGSLQQEQFAEAVPLLEALVDSFGARYGPEGQSTVNARKDLKTLHETVMRRHAEAYRRVADLSRSGQHDEALEEAHRLAALSKALERSQPQMYGDALTLLAECHLNLRRFSEAAPIFSQAIELIARAFGDDNLMIASRRERLGKIYEAMDLIGQTEEQYRIALAVRERHSGRDEEALGQSLQRLGMLYLSQGRADEAAPLLKRSLDIVETETRHNERRKTEGMDEALKSLGVFDTTKANLADALNNFGLALTAQGKFEEAERTLRRSLEVEAAVRGADNPELAAIRLNLAELYTVRNQLDQAETELDTAGKLIMDKLGERHPALAHVFLKLGLINLKRGRPADAEILLNGAVALHRQLPDGGGGNLSVSLQALGWTLYSQRRWEDASKTFQEAAELSVKRAIRESRAPQSSADAAGRALLELGRSVFLGEILAGSALAESSPARDGELLEATFRAAQWAQHSDAGLALTRMSARLAAARSDLSDLVRERQDLVASWRVTDGDATAATLRPASQRDPQLLGTLRGQLDGMEKRIREIDLQLKTGFPDYAVLANPEPFSVGDVRKVMRPDEALVLFLDTADADQVAGATFVWVITADTARWKRIALPRAELTARVAALRCGLDWGAWQDDGGSRCAALLGLNPDQAWRPERLPPFDLTKAHELYKTLLGPFEDVIKDKHLLLVPSGALTSLPLHVLVTMPPDHAQPFNIADYRKAAWLMRGHAQTVLPSIASFVTLRQHARASVASDPFIGFGNPVLVGNPRCGGVLVPDKCPDGETLTSDAEKGLFARVSSAFKSLSSYFRSGLADVAEVRTLCPLPDTAHELRCIARSTGAAATSVVLGADATETAVKHATLARYRVVHFATHGLLGSDTAQLAHNLAEPALVLTPPKQPTEADDGLLTASEIAGLKLDADWVVMSACNTAGGGAPGTEALAGLARAFFYAGARALLVSHWPVNSNAATMLTSTTFDEMRKDAAIGRSEAFRRSMLALIDSDARGRTAHPSVWAPFVVVGEGSGAVPH